VFSHGGEIALSGGEGSSQAVRQTPLILGDGGMSGYLVTGVPMALVGFHNGHLTATQENLRGGV
jgi:hypothetical protein